MVVKRYRRTAFPDAFNERLRPAWRGKGGIEPRLKADHGQLSDLLIDLLPNDRELADGEDYVIGTLMGVMRVEDFEDPAKHRTATKLLEDIAESIGSKCSGIDLGGTGGRRWEIRSEANLTLYDLRNLARWDWQYLSLSEESEHTLSAPE